MIGGIIINMVIVICSFWVFIDATNHNIGTYSVYEKGCWRKKGFPPIVWGVGSLFLLPFFIYIFDRKKLIDTANNTPVKTDKSLGFLLFFLITSGLMIFNFSDVLFY